MKAPRLWTFETGDMINMLDHKVLELSKSFVTNITRPQASKAHENLRKNLKTVLAINGLSPAVEILGIMLSCGRGFEPHIASCRKCNTSSYQDSYKNLSCVACPKHARTELGAVSKENCTCRRGYQGPKGGPLIWMRHRTKV